MKEIEVDKELHKEERPKLEHFTAKLLKAGHGCKEKMDKIKKL